MKQYVKYLAVKKLVLTAVFVLCCWQLQQALPVSADPEARMPEDIAGIPVPTATPTPTPSARPTPTTTPRPPCAFHKGELKYLGINLSGSVAQPWSLSGNLTRQNTPCIDQFLRDTENAARYYGSYRDDMFAYKTALSFFMGALPKSTSRNPHYLANGAYCDRFTIVAGDPNYQDIMWHHFTGDLQHRYCLNGYFYFDSQCRVVPESTVQQLCGDINVDFKIEYLKSTPISLLWTEDADINEQTAVVSFPLHGSAEPAFHLWKCSAKTPLLVYNPSHDGNITSATQLFGSWTFGGKKTASLAETVADAGNAPQPQPWKNGYEALAELDADNDGRISGKELEPLALWFDSNQDAKAQQGEVTPIAETGITALFYTPDRTDTAAGLITASKGYERIKNGAVVTGKSVDWYAAEADSPLALLGKHVFDRNMLEAGRNGAPSAAAAASQAAENFALDRWAFRLEGTGADAAPDGWFLLHESEDGSLQGYTIIEKPFAQAPEELRSMAVVFGLAGSRLEKDGVQHYNFVSESRGQTTKSTADLSPDKSKMSGRSTIEIEEPGATRQIVYTWNAERL